jgi:hypothetical protein
MIKRIPEPIPAITQFVRPAKQQRDIKARAFFHFGQLRGSLGSSLGCGTSTISVLALSLNRCSARN